MKRLTSLFAGIALLGSFTLSHAEDGFVPLFDGKSLEGWKASENPESFKVADGAIVALGPRAHAFYVGEVNGAKFENFELRLEVMTKPNSNGGIFIHTEWVDEGWPPKGYEIQANNTQKDWRKTGGLYGIVDNKEPFEDNTWMKYVILVKDGVITSIVNGKELVKYQPEGEDSRLQKGGGAIALQAHDPGSEIHYRNIRIKVLD